MAKRKAANGSGTIRLRPDGRYEGIYTVGHDPGTGKLIRKSVYAKTQKECAKKLREAINAVDTGSYVEPSKMTVEQWLNTWLAEYCKDVKQRTMDKYRSTVRLHLIPALGKTKLSTLNKIQVQRAFNKLGDKERPLAAKTVHDIHGILHRALQQAIELDIIAKNPADNCKLPRAEKTEIKPMNKQQISMFIEEIKTSRFGNVFMFDLLTGLRMGEMLALSWDCVDFEKGILRIRRQLHQVKGGYVFGTLKNDKPRYVPVPASVLELLKKQRTQQRLWKLAAGVLWQNEEDLVFTNEVGRHLAPNTVRAELRRVTKQMNMESFRFHDLRHSYATLCLSEGVDIKTLQSNLGHHTPAFTMEQYGHCTDEMKQASANRLESFIQSVSNL